MCANFQDQLLLEYLEYGFPLCADRSSIAFGQLVENHPSANNFPEDVDIYLNKELRHQTIVGPFKQIPFPVHYSSLLSRPKPGDSRRIIVKLSHPAGTSVNNGISDCVYNNRPFLLKYPTVDSIIDNINQFNSEGLLSKIDLSRAFRNLHGDPLDFDLLGIHWQRNTFLDISIPMGMRTGSALCQRTTDIICHIMHYKGLCVYNYIDNIICVHRRQISTVILSV